MIKRLIIFLCFVATAAAGQDFAAIARDMARRTDTELLVLRAPSDYTITTKEWNIDGTKYKPGDRLILQGPRAEIRFTNLRGTKEAPIIITATSKTLIKAANLGSKVVLFINCDYVHFTGGEGRMIEITGGAHGIDYGSLSNHPEFSYLDIHDTGATGLGVKSYPTCDPATWRGAFTLADMKVHHCNIWNVGTEGMYLGPSHYATSFPLTGCAGGVTTALEHAMVNAQVWANKVWNCGADGIQLGAATGGSEIWDNEVTNVGTAKVYGQASGIQANPGSVCIIRDNIIDGCTNFGIIHQGRQAGSAVRNNRVKNTVGGIMTVAREGNNGSFLVENNTFENITGNLVQIYNDTEIRNNVMNLASGTTYVKVMSGKITDTNNAKSSGKLGTIPAGVGYKPKPVVVKEAGNVELITTDGIDAWYLTTPSGKRKKIE